MRGLATRPGSSSPPAGFTLVELIVSLLAASVLAAGLASVLIGISRAATAQTRLVGLRQSLRLALEAVEADLRRAGRGGLEAGPLPSGLGLAVVNDVPPGTRIAGPGSGVAAAGTDVLVVRGVLTGGLFRIAPGGWTRDGLIVRVLTPEGRFQDLEPLASLLATGRTEALWLGGPPGAGAGARYELAGGTVRGAAKGRIESLLLKLRPVGAATPPTAASHLGILEERRYFIRAPRSPAEPPRLARARLRPGADRPHPSDPRRGRDLVDGVEDLQVALAIDRDGDGSVREGDDAAGRADDEWLFNHPGDARSPELWVGRLRLVRVTLLARSNTAEPGHLAAPIRRLEDHLYDESARPRSPEEAARRRFRRLRGGLIVAPRNL